MCFNSLTGIKSNKGGASVNTGASPVFTVYCHTHIESVITTFVNPVWNKIPFRSLVLNVDSPKLVVQAPDSATVPVQTLVLLIGRFSEISTMIYSFIW